MRTSVRYLCAAAVALGCAGPALADMPVIDVTSIGKAVQQLRQLQQEYAQLQTIYSSLAHPTGVLGMAPQLSTNALRNVIPGASQVGGIISGTGGSSALTGLIGQIQQQNQTYRPEGTDWSAQWINRSATGNAGVQALAQNMISALQQRTQGLNELQAQLGQAQDVTQVDAINARLASEQNFATTQLGEAQLLSTLASTQARAEDQQIIQKQRQDDDRFFQDTTPGGAAQPMGVNATCAFCG